MTFEQAMADPLLALCIRNYARARQRRMRDDISDFQLRS